MGVQLLQKYVSTGSLYKRKTYTPTSLSPPLILDAANVSRFISKSYSDPCYGGSPELLHRECRRILSTLQRCSEPGMVLVYGWDSSLDKEAKQATTIARGRAHMRKVIDDIHSFDMAPMVRSVFCNVAKELGIEILNCDANDDVAIARLARDRAGLVMSDDSDFCIFDVPGVLNVKSLSCDSNGNMFEASFFTRRLLAIRLNIGTSLLPIWASLCGNDFLRGGPGSVLQAFHDQLALDGHFYPNNRFKVMEAVANFLGTVANCRGERKIKTGLVAEVVRKMPTRSSAEAERMRNDLQYSLAFYASPNDARTTGLYSPHHSALELMGNTIGPNGALVHRQMPPRMLESFRCGELSSLVPTADFCNFPTYIPCIPYGYLIGDCHPYFSCSKLRGDALFMLFQDCPNELVFQCKVPFLKSMHIDYDDDVVSLSSLSVGRECLPSVFTIFGDEPLSVNDRCDIFTQRFGVTPTEVAEFKLLFGELPDWDARLLNSCALKYYSRECREPAHEAELIVFACCIARPRDMDEQQQSLGARFRKLTMDGIAEQHIFSCVNRWVEICNSTFALHQLLDSPLGTFDPRLVLFNGKKVMALLNQLYCGAAGKAGSQMPLRSLLEKVLGSSSALAHRMVGWIYKLVATGLDDCRPWESIDHVALILPSPQSTAKSAHQRALRSARLVPTEDWDKESVPKGIVDQVPSYVLPDEVKKYIIWFEGLFRQGNTSGIEKAYDLSHKKLTDKYFSDQEWPTADVIAPLFTDKAFLLFYNELFFRHIYAELTPTIEQRLNSFANYEALFKYFLEAKDSIRFPEKWLWEIVDEFIYQFQKFVQYRCKLNSRTDSEKAILQDNPRVWSAFTVFSTLQLLVDTSKINTILRNSEGGVIRSPTNLQLLGFFSIVGLVRAHTLVGDYHLALRVLDVVELSEKALYTHVAACQISLYYYMGVSYLMMRRYQDAVRMFSSILCTMSAQHSPTTGYDNLAKRQQQLFSLLALAFTLSPCRVDEAIYSQLLETYDEQMQQIRSGDEAAIEDLFSFGCPKFLSPVAPNYDGVPLNSTMDPFHHQYRVFQEHATAHVKLASVSYVMKLYSTMPLTKLASLLDTTTEKLPALLHDYKLKQHKFSQLVWSSGPVLSGTRTPTNDVDFYIDGDMIHTTNLKAAPRCDEYFIRQLHQLSTL